MRLQTSKNGRVPARQGDVQRKPQDRPEQTPHHSPLDASCSFISALFELTSQHTSLSRPRKTIAQSVVGRRAVECGDTLSRPGRWLPLAPVTQGSARSCVRAAAAAPSCEP